MQIVIDQNLFFILKLLISAFVAILFLQSGFDKVFDFKDNLVYIQSVFSKTFLAPFSSIVFVIITILEVSAGLILAFGIVQMFRTEQENFAVLGLELAALSLLALFFGQRVAKDYAGAVSLVSYFILVVFGLFLFSI